MKQGSDNFVPESTPVIDLRKNGLPPSVDISANDPTQNWDNDKTEVYMDSDEDEATASLIDEDGDSHPITAFPFVLGRGTECDLVLSGKGLSRKHVEIVFQSGRFVVNDLDSLNGLKVNGYKVSRVILEESDEIKLGEVNLTFVSGDTDAEREASVVAPGSTNDPFGDGGGRKVTKAVGGIFSVALIIGGAFYAYKMMQPNQSADQLVQVAPKSKAAPSLPAQIPSNKPTTSTPAIIASAPPKPLSAPPPSISKGVKKIQLPVASIPEPVIAKPVSRPVLKKVKVSRNLPKAKKALASASTRYLDGDADALFKDLRIYGADSTLPLSLRTRLKGKHESLAAVYADYVKGQKAYAQQNHDGAFNYWTRFLEKEGRLFTKTRSLYADQVVLKVVDEYVTRGNKASQTGENHKAYKMWQKAVKLGDSVAAKIALDSVSAKSKQLYRKALRLEYVNASKAKALWQEVVSLVPPGTEYYTKASSKLAWYERWGG
ncbi:hypothetical protein A9Q99_04400 [Gammaproteobacteria bacterium 45_16_T64]|nr:hypothetical protein A9Q99_04400 [Gammaproteobacteria bacterium 45_16_T64]